MSRRPESGEFAAYYATYVNRVPHDDVLTVLAEQLRTVPQALHGISEEKSLHRYAPGKWSIRELLHHVNDCERVFAFRALWFARGFDSALPGFDENAGAVAAQSDLFPWADRVEEFTTVRRATLSLLRNLPDGAWTRQGIANGNPFSVRALAFIVAGHVEHHLAILRERYLGAGV